MKSIVETLLAPVDEASGTARSLTAVELGDIMTKMDRDNNGDVDFEEFYYWYEAEMGKKQVKLDLQLKMTLFEKDASARAEAMAESKIFEVKQKLSRVSSPMTSLSPFRASFSQTLAQLTRGLRLLLVRHLSMRPCDCRMLSDEDAINK